MGRSPTQFLLDGINAQKKTNRHIRDMVRSKQREFIPTKLWRFHPQLIIYPYTRFLKQLQQITNDKNADMLQLEKIEEAISLRAQIRKVLRYNIIHVFLI